MLDHLVLDILGRLGAVGLLLVSVEVYPFVDRTVVLLVRVQWGQKDNERMMDVDDGEHAVGRGFGVLDFLGLLFGMATHEVLF